MMGRSHAATGAAAGFAVAALTPQPSSLTGEFLLLVTGTLVGAGSALLPDLDHPNATATHALGWLTRFLGWLLRGASQLAHWATATTYDNGDGGGHRHLTHTIAFAALVGVVLAWGASVSVWVAAVALWTTISLALRGLIASFSPDTRQRAWTTGVGVSLGAAAITGVLVVGGGVAGAYLGVCVAVGMVVHTLGDALTKQACPMLWPLKIRGKRWYDIGMPAVLRFSTGAWPERVIAWVCWAVPVVGMVLVVG